MTDSVCESTFDTAQRRQLWTALDEASALLAKAELKILDLSTEDRENLRLAQRSVAAAKDRTSRIPAIRNPGR